MVVVTKNHEHGDHGSIIEDRDLKWKPNTTKFGSIFNFNMLLAILDGSHYQKSQKWHYGSNDSFLLLKTD